MRDKDSQLISEAYILVRESVVRECDDCSVQFGVRPPDNASHGKCRRHCLEWVRQMGNLPGATPELTQSRIAKIMAKPDSDFSPDMAEKFKTQSVAESHTKIIAKDIPPPYLSNGDEDGELEMAAKYPFSAYAHALQTNKHHPKLLHAVLGSPYEKLYKQHLKIKD